MIEALTIIDELKLSDMTDDFDYRLKRRDSLRNIIFFGRFQTSHRSS